MRSVEAKTGKVYTDMYEGEGQANPPVTTRLDRLEKQTTRFEQCFIDMANETKTTRQMMATTMLTVIGGIVTAFICYKLGIRV